MIASLFTPVEAGADALVRACGLDPLAGAGAALAFFLYEFIKVSILILAISWGMALVRRSLPMGHVRRWLTTPLGRLLGYPAAAAFGAVTPFCSCSSVPLFIGFIEAGIPVGVTFAFLITSPLVNEIVVALFLASFGWKVAALYSGAGIVLGIVGGLAIQALRGEQMLSVFARSLRNDHGTTGATGATTEKPCCCGGGGEENRAAAAAPKFVATSPMVFKPGAAPTVCGPFIAVKSTAGCCATPRPRREPGALAFATGEAWGIYRQIVAYLLIALVIGAGIHGYLPEGFFAEFFSTGAWWHVPVATVIGLPLYASANATVPILETLVAKGVPLGTGMALIMSAVGVSLPELVLLKRVMTVRLLALFTLVVSVGVMAVGYLFNTLPPGW